MAIINVTSVKIWDIFRKISQNVGNGPKKKGKSLIKGYISISFKSNLIEVPSNTWRLDYRATTHISNTLHGFFQSRP